jgi:predicted Zn-dependent protease with MMP-like domain
MLPAPPPLRLIARASAAGLLVALVAIVIANPPSSSGTVRTIELIGIIVLGLFTFAGAVALISTHLAGWRESEAEFELTVQRSERLARENLAADPDEGEFLELDPLRDADFEALVRDALDDLPDLLQNALRHVAVVISNGGRRARAYGLYQGDGSHHDNHPDRVVIFRDTLRRDFGHDPDALREQVTRTVRHELAHHVGFDELGVSGLGL